MPDYFWDPWALKYGTIAGEFVADGFVLSLIEDYMDDVVRMLDRITDDLIDGTITLPQWQTAMARRIKDANVNVMALGRGGREQLTPEDWDTIEKHVKFQFDRLDNFAQELTAGSVSPAQAKFRAKMYGRSSRTPYWEGLQSAAKGIGYMEMRRVLMPAEHCIDCIEYAEQGWVPVGNLPMPGQGSRCMVNCKCVVEYRFTPSAK